MTALHDLKYLPADRARQELGVRLTWLLVGALGAAALAWPWGYAVGHRDGTLPAQLARRAALQACSDGETAAIIMRHERERGQDSTLCLSGSTRLAGRRP